MENKEYQEAQYPATEKKRTGKRSFYRHHKQKKSPVRIAILVICGLMMGTGAFGLGGYIGFRMNERDELRKLSESVKESAAVTTTATAESMAVTEPQALTTEATLPADPAELAVKTILPQYAQLYQENNDLYGWIKIEDTRIDYPVMYSPDDPEKYLHANFEENYSYAGLPFLDANCTPDSDNLLIYGHNMLDGSMFRSLMEYERRDYWEKHPVIHFDTLYEEQTFEVLAAFYDRVYYKTETVFKFYQFIDAADEAEFDAAIAKFKEKSLYDTGVEASYGDQLITLVTCAYHTENGRFVVVARRMEEPDGQKNDI